MEANLIGAILISALSMSQGTEFNYTYSNKEICMDIKMDVKLYLTNGNETVNFSGNNFTVKNGECANTGEYQSWLAIENKKADVLTFIFLVVPDLTVNMSLKFEFAPFEYFPVADEIQSNIIDLMTTRDSKLGDFAKLYMCKSTQRVTLNGQLGGVTYTLYIDMSNVQIQAFDIQNGNLSTDVFVCSADHKTTDSQTTEDSTTNSSNGPTTEPSKTNVTTITTQPTTEPSKSNLTTDITQPTTEPTTINVTTTEPSTTNGTTEHTTVGPSNSTSEIPTTGPTSVAPTIPPPPPKSTYTVKNGSKACVIMEGRFQLEVTYMNKKNASSSRTVNIPESSHVTVNGTCDPGNSSLTIIPREGAITSLTFNFINNNHISQLLSWSADVDLKHFPDAKRSELKHTVNEIVNLSSPKLYYKCDLGGNFSDNTKVLTFIFTEFQVQAFNVEDGKFSGNGEDCEKDVEPIPAPGEIPKNKFVVKDPLSDEVCVLFNGRIQFNIPYVSNKGINVTKSVPLPTKYTITGNCNTTLNGYYSQRMIIGFYDNWKMTMFFSSDLKQSKLLTVGQVSKYHISQIELNYDYNNNIFDDAVESLFGKNDSVLAANLTQLTTDATNSYLCNKDTTFDLQHGFSMVTKDLRYQAFKVNTTDFDDATECEGDTKTDSIVPIAVGAALAGLVLLVLVAYVFGRRRSRSEYSNR
ncbi:lysosome-associated membrane glycoprotein 1-like [Saccostrea echinata]|uniref:lysosome-associated membrane glycoprotein 1-like n=1 Tax=Saccostrea echinata TaxID=191078 RepID=UPI002A82A121|nr:lysosome-associated membrane glycoprotein 1-like [Saccostrea echinata]